jgi:hypothetical protein
MKKVLLLTAAIVAGAIFSAPVRAQVQGDPSAATSAAPAETVAPSAPVQPSAAFAVESKPAIPPDSEWVHPTK